MDHNIKHIFVIDDDERFLKSITKVLQIRGYEVTTCAKPTTALEIISDGNYHCILLDVKMPTISGLKLLKEIKKENDHVPVVMVSGQSDISTAVTAIKEGAYDFIEKPLIIEKMMVTIQNAAQYYDLKISRKILLSELQEKYDLIGVSKAIQHIASQIETIAGTRARVLILGDSGTGKEIVARAIHLRSDRFNQPYIKVNCAAIPKELLESELFGHKKGSFTGANRDKDGKFLAADKGSIFLDEIGDMALSLQAKILRTLQESEIEVIGENISRKVDVRVIAASNKDLEALVQDGKFREDLYHRLNVVTIYIPPLRNRKDDITPLAEFFLSLFADEYNKEISKFTSSAMNALNDYPWPGNVRELRNTVENLVIFSQSNVIDSISVLSILNRKRRSGEIDLPSYRENIKLKDAEFSFEHNFLIETLEKNNWKIVKTAEDLGINRSHLFKKMKQHNIQKPIKE